MYRTHKKTHTHKHTRHGHTVSGCMHFSHFFSQNTLPAELRQIFFFPHFFFIVTQTHYRLSGDWELRHYYLHDCWHVRSEEAERRCVAYDDRPEAWCKSFSEGTKNKKRRQRGVLLHMMTAPRLGNICCPFSFFPLRRCIFVWRRTFFFCSFFLCVFCLLYTRRRCI